VFTAIDCGQPGTCIASPNSHSMMLFKLGIGYQRACHVSSLHGKHAATA
jgi:hypothetical protein